MSRPRRKFSVEQKLQIIQEADQNGTTQTLRKYNLSHSVYLRWKNQFNAGGAGSLASRYRKTGSEVQALLEENARLKKIIGNQALELEFKTELLKKAMPTGASGNADPAVRVQGSKNPLVAELVYGEFKQFLLQIIRQKKRSNGQYSYSKPGW